MLLFLDTETTGLPNFNLPSDHESQPHLVQFAAVMIDDGGIERASVRLTVRPDGWTIPADTAAIHGITTEIAAACGVDAGKVVDIYRGMLDQATIAIAHNANFDERIMRIASMRHGYDRGDVEAIAKPLFCTMTKSTPVLNLPPSERMVASGRTGPKPPRLSECIKHFFGEDLVGAHDAMIDVRACARVYFHLKSLERAA